MNRNELIEEINEYGCKHESIQDYIADSDDKELEFFLWRLQNKWEPYDSNDRFVHLPSLKVVSREKLMDKFLTRIK